METTVYAVATTVCQLAGMFTANSCTCSHSWRTMATTNPTYSSAAVPGRIYDRYTRSKVLELDEPIVQDSDDELELDLGSGDEM